MDGQVLDIEIEWTFQYPEIQGSVQIVGPDNVISSIKLATQGPGSSLSRRWKYEPAELAQLKEALAAVREQDSELRGEYKVKKTLANGTITRFAWSSQKETAEQRHLRELLGRLGHIAYLQAKAYFERGQELSRNQGALQEEIEAYKKGVEALGYEYQSPTSIDDTGRKLMLAMVNLKQGELALARNLLERVLQSRIEMYEQTKIQGAK